MTTVQHAGSVLDLGDGRCRATCACGRKWIPTTNRQLAESQVERHLSYHAEVAALMGEYDA